MGWPSVAQPLILRWCSTNFPAVDLRRNNFSHVLCSRSYNDNYDPCETQPAHYTICFIPFCDYPVQLHVAIKIINNRFISPQLQKSISFYTGNFLSYR